MISKLIPTFGLCLLAVATTASTSVGSLRLADDWNLRQGPVQPTDDDWNLRQGPANRA